jgi:hypothetical protein
MEEIYRAFARRDTGILSANFDQLVCPYLPICDPVVNGQIVKWDRQHLTVKFAESLADPVDAYLKTARLLPNTPPASPSPNVTMSEQPRSSTTLSEWPEWYGEGAQ